MAKQYFDEAMLCDITNINIPQFYIGCLIANEDFTEAEKLIKYTLKMKGIDKSNIWFYRSLLSEKRGSYMNALKFLKHAEKYCFNSHSLDIVKNRKKFVKSKINKKSKEKRQAI
ncbi:hypothetical protein [Chryseobacterium sp. Leaf313]|uniref:hypothetical protein n=1 Tax=Chryseobacterium sp. Leaf313 TaxID=2876563 RepID=UPI001E636B0E|nr:hypothetical protein [Chryseobacterium sp. Leaf313]